MATEQSLPELIVKEAVGAGLDSSMRESILEAVEDAEGSRRRLSIPIAAGAFGLGAVIGYVFGSQESVPIEVDAEPLSIEEPTETITSGGKEETDGADDENGGSRLARLAVLLAVGGAIAYLRLRRGREEEGWEPIDELDQSLDEGTSAVVEGLTDETPSDEPESESTTTEDESSTDESESDAGGAESNEDA